MPEVKANVRSPFFLKYTQSGMTNTKIEIYVYSGTKTTDKGSILATLNKAPLPGDNYVIFEISDIVREYLTKTIATPLNNNKSYIKWIQVESTIST